MYGLKRKSYYFYRPNDEHYYNSMDDNDILTSTFTQKLAQKSMFLLTTAVTVQKPNIATH